MIKNIHYKIDKYNIIGLRADIVIQSKIIQSKRNITELAQVVASRVETLIMLGKDNMLLQGFKTNNNIFEKTADFSKSFYFPFFDIQFIGKAIIKFNYNKEILSIAMAEIDYTGSPILDTLTGALKSRKPGLVSDGDIPVLWKPMQLTPNVEAIVRRYVEGYII